jgi:hypothetical protein
MRRPCFTASRQIDGIEAAQIERQHPWRGSERRRAACDGAATLAQQQDLKPQVRSVEAEYRCAVGAPAAALLLSLGLVPLSLG